MKQSRARRIFLSALLAAMLSSLVFTACASTHKAAVKQTSAESGRSLAAGDYEKALDLQKKLYQQDPNDKRTLTGYIKTIEEVKRAADRARSQGEYGPAGGAYRLLINNWAGFSAFASKLTFVKSDVEAGMRRCRIAMYEAQFRQEIKAARYDKALAVYQTALKEYPGDKTLKAGYAAAAGEIKTIGSKALAGHDYALAGKVHGLLLKNIASFDGLEKGTALNRKDLDEAIELCSAQLTNRGLTEYRQGNLQKAIAVWEDLLAFDPENAEIKKAVETAKAQLRKLKAATP